MDATTTTTSKKSGNFQKVVSSIKGACKDAIPATKGGKIVAGATTAVVAAGSFFIGRLTKKNAAKK
jgi:hypothetical protein